MNVEMLKNQYDSEVEEVLKENRFLWESHKKCYQNVYSTSPDVDAWVWVYPTYIHVYTDSDSGQLKQYIEAYDAYDFSDKINKVFENLKINF